MTSYESFFALFANVYEMISDETINVKLSNDDEILNYCNIFFSRPFYSPSGALQISPNDS